MANVELIFQKYWICRIPGPQDSDLETNKTTCVVGISWIQVKNTR